MIEKLETNAPNALALQVIDGFSETDEKLCQKYFDQKLTEGCDHVNVLVKVDELNIHHIEARAFLKDLVWTLNHYKQMGHLAIVGHSNVLKNLIKADNLFYQNKNKGRLERYFDISELNEAMAFVDGPEVN